MAEAHLISEVVPQPPAPEITGVNLNLTVREARLIRDLVGACNGYIPEVGTIYRALKGLGFGLTKHTYTLNIDLLSIDYEIQTTEEDLK